MELERCETHLFLSPSRSLPPSLTLSHRTSYKFKKVDIYQQFTDVPIQMYLYINILC